jgi:hypothetical protein
VGMKDGEKIKIKNKEISKNEIIKQNVSKTERERKLMKLVRIYEYNKI